MSSSSLSNAKSLAASYGTPLYVYDLNEVEQRLGELRSFLPEGASIYYSLKANPLPAIVSALVERGAAAEVSSPGELEAALSAAAPPDGILYTGPGKTCGEIKQALDAGVTFFSCESAGDYTRIAQAAAAARKRVRLLLRINPSKSPGAGLTMSGVSSQFGIEEDDLALLAGQLRATEGHVDVVGFHLYYGTQVAPADALEQSFRSGVEISGRLARAFGIELRVLDLGGGFSWPFAKRGKNPELANLKSCVPAFVRDAGLRDVRLCFESGRYLCASSGTLLTTVVDVKTSKGRKFVVTDAGVNALGGMSGLGRIMAPQLDVEPVSVASPGGPHAEASIVGPLCSPLDYLARNTLVPDLRPGDVIGIPNVGAYGVTASLGNFLSRPYPLEVAHRGGRVVGVYQLRGGHRLKA